MLGPIVQNKLRASRMSDIFLTVERNLHLCRDKRHEKK